MWTAPSCDSTQRSPYGDSSPGAGAVHHIKSSCEQPQQYSLLFDHLVGASEESWRHVEAECPGGLHVDHQLVLRWRLHRQLAGLLTLEDAIDVAGGAAILIGIVGAITHQAARACEVAERIYGRHVVPSRERRDHLRMVGAEAACGNDQPPF